MREQLPRKSNKSAWRKVGYCPAVAATNYAVWGVASDYSFLAAVTKPNVVSTSTADVMTTGTGAWQVKVTYLDLNFAEKSEVVALNGTTAVPMAAEDVFRVNDVRVISAGTGMVAAGIITVKNTANAITLASILAGENTSKQLIYTVPANKMLEIFDGVVSNRATTTLKGNTFKIMSNYDAANNVVRRNATGPILYTDFQIDTDQSTAPIYFGRDMEQKEMSLKYPAGTDIICKVLGVATGIVSCTLLGIEYPI